MPGVLLISLQFMLAVSPPIRGQKYSCTPFAFRTLHLRRPCLAVEPHRLAAANGTISLAAAGERLSPSLSPDLCSVLIFAWCNARPFRALGARRVAVCCLCHRDPWVFLACVGVVGRPLLGKVWRCHRPFYACFFPCLAPGWCERLLVLC